MSKPVNLADFHFDQIKSGQILKSWIQSAGVSYAYVSKETGITADTLNNCLRGAVQDLRIERVYKIGLVTGHTVSEYIAEMMADESVDFSAQIADVYGAPPQAAETETPPVSMHDIEAYSKRMHDEENERLDRFKSIYGAMIDQLREQIAQLKESREIMKAQYLAQIDEMKLQHAETIARADKEIKRLERANRWKNIALTIETVFIVGISMIDLANTNVGWYRGLTNYPSGKIGMKG